MELKLQNVRRCDFCNEFNAPYLWTFHSQTIPAGTPLDAFQELLEHPEWFACEDCHGFILTRNLTALLNHNKDIKTAEHREYFAKFYQSLLANLQRN